MERKSAHQKRVSIPASRRAKIDLKGLETAEFILYGNNGDQVTCPCCRSFVYHNMAEPSKFEGTNSLIQTLE
jgi:hypothetical protein